MKVATFTMLFSLTIAFGSGLAADETPKGKLDEAKAKYLKEMTAYRDEVQSYFDQREEAARKEGNKKQLDVIRSEKQFFEETEVVPRSAAKLSQHRSEIRNRMEKSYSLAVKELTKVKQDDEAARVEHESKAFSNLLGAWVDVNPRGHAFLFRFGGEVVELDADRKLHTTGEWGVDKSDKLVVNLANGYTLRGLLPTISSTRVEVYAPGKTTADLTLNLRRVLR